MPDDEALVYEIRDKLIAFMDAHRRTCTKGERCREDCNLLAFLAHSLGIRGDKLLEVNRLIRDYDARCTGCEACEAHKAHARAARGLKAGDN